MYFNKITLLVASHVMRSDELAEILSNQIRHTMHNEAVLVAEHLTITEDNTALPGDDDPEAPEEIAYALARAFGIEP